MQKYLLLIAFTATIGFVVYGYVTTCPRLTPQERLARSDAVFLAKAEGAKGTSRKRQVTLEVFKSWKGVLDKRVTMESKAFLPGHTYLIYANRYQDMLYASRCGGWKEDGEAEAEAVALDKAAGQ